MRLYPCIDGRTEVSRFGLFRNDRSREGEVKFGR